MLWNKRQIKRDVIDHDIINRNYQFHYFYPALLQPNVYGTLQSGTNINEVWIQNAAGAGSRAGYSVSDSYYLVDSRDIRSFRITFTPIVTQNLFTFVGLGDTIPTAAVPPSEPGSGIYLRVLYSTNVPPLQLRIKLGSLDQTINVIDVVEQQPHVFTIERDFDEIKVRVQILGRDVFEYKFTPPAALLLKAFAVAVSQAATVTPLVRSSQFEIVSKNLFAPFPP